MGKAEHRRAIKDLDRASKELHRLRANLVLAYEFEWEAPRGRQDPDDPGIRSRGGHKDPTGDVVVSEARLNLRRQVKKLERDSLMLDRAVACLSADLLQALRPYELEDKE